MLSPSISTVSCIVRFERVQIVLSLAFTSQRPVARRANAPVLQLIGPMRLSPRAFFHAVGSVRCMLAGKPHPGQI